MQKYKLWIVIVLLIIVILSLMLWLKPENNMHVENQADQSSENSLLTVNRVDDGASPQFPSHSQSDTEIDCKLVLDQSNRLIVNENTRNCFEYFITQYGEKDLNKIRQDFKVYIEQHYQEPARAQILDLWQRYMEYRESLVSITPPSGLDKEDPKYFQAIFESTQNLRKQFFSNYEIEGLFGAEDLYHNYTLKRMQIFHETQLTEAEKAQRLQELFDQLPVDWQENLKQMNQLDDLRKLTDEIKQRGGSPEELRQMRLNLVGAEATQRLEDLDQKRDQWKNRVNDYLKQRRDIQQSGLSADAKSKAIQDLRQRQFPQSQEQLRLETFEKIHDQGGKLPFPD